MFIDVRLKDWEQNDKWLTATAYPFPFAILLWTISMARKPIAVSEQYDISIISILKLRIAWFVEIGMTFNAAIAIIQHHISLWCMNSLSSMH